MSAEYHLSADSARRFANDWIEAWNLHDLDRIMAHYAESVVLTSPIAAVLLNNRDGTVRGRQALRAYFQKGLEAYPQLRLELIEVMWGLNSIVLYYQNHKGTKSGEFMEFDSQGKVARVVANYSG